MIADIEAGKVKCVITKDLSRLGRNYIEAGSYIEVFFPRHNVRYIAITDGVDSVNRQEMDITPFKNILNDLYSRDISKKVLAGWMARSRQGKFLGGPTPYGLMRDPNDHGHLIIDPETAPTVKLVFDLALNGYGTMKIAKHLLERKIPITRIKEPVESEVRYYSWSGSVIGKMLRNPVYKGDHVVCKCHQKAIRSNTVNFIPRDQWEIIENCHEAIVSREQWARVQKLIDRRPTIMQGNSCPFYNLFHGLVTVPPVGNPCRCAMRRSAELERTALPEKCGNRLIRLITFARPTTVWERTPAPATRLKPATSITSFWLTLLSMARWLCRTQKRSMGG